MADPEEEFNTNLGLVNDGKANFSEDEQKIIDAWVNKLREKQNESNQTDDDKTNRNEYARTLARLVNEEKQLLAPFDSNPPDGDLTPLIETGGKQKKFSFKKMPCPRPTSGQKTGAIPKTKKPDRNQVPFEPYPRNEFEDPTEMAKVIARSKGQSFAEFVALISRHTSDFGQRLRTAMTAETTSFRDYVDHVLSQRIKDLTEVLDEEQYQELQKIKKDIDRWQMELSHVKKRIKEMIPDFDLESYKKDKNYLRKLFTVSASPELREDDSFKRWKDETSHRLKWISDMTCKLARCNEQITQEIARIKTDALDLEANEAIKQQNEIKHINDIINQYQELKSERDELYKENDELLWRLKDMGPFE